MIHALTMSYSGALKHRNVALTDFIMKLYKTPSIKFITACLKRCVENKKGLHCSLGAPGLFTVRVTLFVLIKNVLKRRKESGTYLATDSRHRWRVQMTMKNDK